MSEKNNQRNSKTTKMTSILAGLLLISSFMGVNNIYADSLPTFEIEFGQQGSETGEFGNDSPIGIAVDSSGNIYAADDPNNRIQKFDSDGKFITEWSTFDCGTGSEGFNRPSELDIDDSDYLYVADRNNNQIIKFDSNGACQLKIDEHGLYLVDGVGVDDNTGDIYAADRGNHRIQKFNSEGVHQLTWGSLGTDVGQFDAPCSVRTDSSGDVYVAECNGDRIQKFNSEGVHQLTWGSLGTDVGQFDFPRDIAIVNETIYVADTGNHRIQAFDLDGNLKYTFGKEGNMQGEFITPAGIDADDSKIYVADSGNERIHIFNLSGSTAEIIVNQTTCEDLLGGFWKSTTCRVTDYVNDDKITIPDGITLKIIGKFENKGSIIVDNGAMLLVNGWGVYSNGKLVNSGVVVNNGTTQCARCGLINNNLVVNSGLIINDWKINNYENFYNFGTIENSGNLLNKGFFGTCKDNFIGNPIERNQPLEIC